MTARTEARRGECDCCGKHPRNLKRIDSDDWLCRTCLAEIRPPRPQHLATWKQIEELRGCGFDVDENTTKDRARILRKVLRARLEGLLVADDASEAEVDEAIANRPQTIFTKVRGVTHDNPDGTNRRKLLKYYRPGAELQLIRERDNTYDENAIKVFRRGGLFSREQQLGYLSAALAEELAPLIDRGVPIVAFVSEVTGGEKIGWFGERKNYGLNIKICQRCS